MTQGTKDSVIVGAVALAVGTVLVASLKMLGSRLTEHGQVVGDTYLFTEATMAACGADRIELRYAEGKSMTFRTKVPECSDFHDGRPHEVVMEYVGDGDKWTVKYVGPPTMDHVLPLELAPSHQWKDDR